MDLAPPHGPRGPLEYRLIPASWLCDGGGLAILRADAVVPASTRPAGSKPRMEFSGLEKPSFSRISSPSPRGTRSALTRVSPELTVVTKASTSPSPSAATGFGTSLICTTSGGP